MKKLLILMLLIFICCSKDYPFERYNNIYPERILYNEYELFSGIKYRGNIEYQITFEGTKLQCEAKIIEHNKILDKKIVQFKEMLGEVK